MDCAHGRLRADAYKLQMLRMGLIIDILDIYGFNP